MPFVTEEIWQRFGVGESIAIASWPEPRPEQADAAAERSFGYVQELVTAVRQFRAQHHLPPSKKLDVTAGVPDAEMGGVEAVAERISRMTALGSLTLVAGDAPKADGTVRVAFPDGFVEIPLAGSVDLEAERTRLSKRLADVQRDLERSEKKLANDGFRAKAAPEVVSAEGDRHTRLGAERDQLRAQLAELG
jgi:valyl-tRNA synthetase